MTNTAPEPITGGQAVVRSLIANSVKTLFALPGVQNDWLFNALYDYRDAVKVIHTRHEQGAAYMALGAALATGELAACSVVPGPGVLNAAAALATAYALNAKLLFLTGQIPLPLIGRGTGALHEISDQLGILRGLTKFALRIEHPSEIPAGLNSAIHAIQSGRPRPAARKRPPDSSMPTLAVAMDRSISALRLSSIWGRAASPPAMSPVMLCRTWWSLT